MDANFCQACGMAACVPSPARPPCDVDNERISHRFVEFKSSLAAKPYQRQKSALEEQLAAFLSSFSLSKVVSSCTADDIIKFLIYKDKSGKTIVHSPFCPGIPCECPRRLAAGTIDSLLGKRKAIFDELGRLDASNPVAHPRVKGYLRFVRNEQASLAITPTQAAPLFFIKFQKLIAYLRDLIVNSRSL